MASEKDCVENKSIDDHSRSRSRSPHRVHFNASNNHSFGNRILVENIPYGYRQREIIDLFQQKVGDVYYAEVLEEDGKSKSCRLEFKNSETAEKAVEILKGFEIRGHSLNIKLETVDSKQKETTIIQEKEMIKDDGIATQEFNSEPSFNLYGFNPEYFKSLGIYGPLNKRILVSNLDCNVTEKKLEEVFLLAGDLSKVILHVDKEGKNKGTATIDYMHPLEAVQAISLFNDQQLYNQKMKVCMDSFYAGGGSLPSKLPSGLQGIGKGLGISGQLIQFSKNTKLDEKSKCDIETKKAENKCVLMKKKIVDDAEINKSNAATNEKNQCILIKEEIDDDVEMIESNIAPAERRRPSSIGYNDCAVCLEQYVQPVKLPCSHVFCFLCVKGLILQEKPCALCRQDIPSNYLYFPQLLPVSQSSVVFEGLNQWFYEGKNGWWQYDDRTSFEIEAAYKKHESQCEVSIAGNLYIIDLDTLHQFRKSNPSYRRRIKRDLVSAPKKGVAGIKLGTLLSNTASNNQNQSNASNMNTDASDSNNVSGAKVIVNIKLD